jgi:uncharacterized protein YgbK (DUF1537 family)
MSVLLGAIADDFTGATDLCNTLVRRGMRTVQLIDVPPLGADVADAEAVVIALKSRTIPAAEAIDKSLAALGWLQNAGRSRSCSNIARPSIPPMQAISARSPRR